MVQRAVLSDEPFHGLVRVKFPLWWTIADQVALCHPVVVACTPQCIGLGKPKFVSAGAARAQQEPR